MIRWRILSRDERADPQGTAGAVDVRVSAHTVVPCILEQWHEYKGAWLPVVPEHVTGL